MATIALAGYSDVANVPAGTYTPKAEPQGVLAEQAICVIPALTVQNAVFGIIRFEPGFSLTKWDVHCADLDSSTNVTLALGYIYDDLDDANVAALLSGSTIPQAGGDYIWPTVSGLLTGFSFTATQAGYLVAKITGGATTTAGNITSIAQFTYNLGN